MKEPLSVQSVIDELVDLYPIEKLVLFGSRAVGDFDPRSDFDIAVFAPKLCRKKFSRLRLDAADRKRFRCEGQPFHKQLDNQREV